jgi:hypothetical protein
MAGLLSIGPDDERLVSPRLLDVADELGKIAAAHPVGVVRMGDEPVQRD